MRLMSSIPRPLVSFVVPCYNYARYLPDCLESIFRQEGDHTFEVVAVDDASTDDTQAVLCRFSDPRLRVITHSANRGHIATITEGLRETRGDYIARIDPDDRYRPGFLRIVMDQFASHPDILMVYGNHALIDGCGEVTLDRADRIHGGRDLKGNELIPLLARNFICAPTVIARRHTWLDALPVPEGLAFNDWYFTLMMARAGDFYYTDQVLADYRVHAANHHIRVARNRTEEASIFRLLDLIYAEAEKNPALEERKRRARRHIYASQYADLGDKYFGFRMEADARRCYLAALRQRPDLARRPDPMRRLAGTLIGRQRYELSRSAVQAVVGRVRRDGATQAR
jgi:glycosyltransferase involved in cell wall biosynthesis